jgi:hypothetical protein
MPSCEGLPSDSSTPHCHRSRSCSPSSVRGCLLAAGAPLRLWGGLPTARPRRAAGPRWRRPLGRREVARPRAALSSSSSDSRTPLRGSFRPEGLAGVSIEAASLRSLVGKATHHTGHRAHTGRSRAREASPGARGGHRLTLTSASETAAGMEAPADRDELVQHFLAITNSESPNVAEHYLVRRRRRQF